HRRRTQPSGTCRQEARKTLLARLRIVEIAVHQAGNAAQRGGVEQHRCLEDECYQPECRHVENMSEDQRFGCSEPRANIAQDDEARFGAEEAGEEWPEGAAAVAARHRAARSAPRATPDWGMFAAMILSPDFQHILGLRSSAACAG